MECCPMLRAPDQALGLGPLGALGGAPGDPFVPDPGRLQAEKAGNAERGTTELHQPGFAQIDAVSL
jgi:hypothetical protein